MKFVYRREGRGPLLVSHLGGPGFCGATLTDLGKPAADDFVAGIPDARSVVLPEAGHFLWIDQPEAFRSEVETFLLR